MPGYGIVDDTAGMLPWSWALERLTASHDYWLATTCPDGRPHVVPVWGVWLDESLWFSSGLRARKARNVARDPRCTLTTDNANEPVILDGVATLVRDRPAIERFATAVDEKYATAYGPDFYDPEQNGCYRVTAHTVFALDEKQFTTSPTRWTFTDA